jgi:hypothetical protein
MIYPVAESAGSACARGLQLTELHARSVDTHASRSSFGWPTVAQIDLPKSWLVATCYRLMHTAGDECSAWRLDPAKPGDVIADTLLGVLARRVS